MTRNEAIKAIGDTYRHGHEQNCFRACDCRKDFREAVMALGVTADEIAELRADSYIGRDDGER